MSEDHDEATGHTHQLHECGGLFGCGDEKGTGVLREDIKDAAFEKRSADRLLHMDEVDQEKLDAYLSARGRSRRNLVRASSFMGLLAAVEPWFGKLAQARMHPRQTPPPAASAAMQGRVHVVESTKETVHLGVYDANLAPIVTIDSGDTISFPNTWSHFLNEMQPGVPVDTLAQTARRQSGQGAALDHRPDCREQRRAGGRARDPLQEAAALQLGRGLQQSGLARDRPASAGLCAGAGQVPGPRSCAP